MSSQPDFQDIILKLQSGATILDIGSAFGQELRFLAANGAPSKNMYATDLIPDFWSLSYELFQDKGKFHATFIEDNFLADWKEGEHGLVRLRGKVDIAIAGSFLHLFDWDTQIRAACQIVDLSKPGTMLVGQQVGSKPAEEVMTGWGEGGSRLFYHDRESFDRMWVEVGRITKTKWSVKLEERAFEGMFEKKDLKSMGEKTCLIMFTVMREA